MAKDCIAQAMELPAVLTTAHVDLAETRNALVAVIDRACDAARLLAEGREPHQATRSLLNAHDALAEEFYGALIALVSGQPVALDRLDTNDVRSAFLARQALNAATASLAEAA